MEAKRFQVLRARGNVERAGLPRFYAVDLGTGLVLGTGSTRRECDEVIQQYRDEHRR